MPARAKSGRKQTRAPTRRVKTVARSRGAARDDRPAFEAATTAQIGKYLEQLHRLYPDADCELHWSTPLELLVATILSAQSTDQRVNSVTPKLFAKYKTAKDFARASPALFEREIQSTGFFRQKTKSVLGAALRIEQEFGGEVPQTMEELVTLPGVARKTANVVLGTAFRKPVGVVVDTHVKRLAFRLGLSAEHDPVKIEQDLMRGLPLAEWIFGGHALIWHGRRVCHARKPVCEQCALAGECPRNGVSDTSAVT